MVSLPLAVPFPVQYIAFLGPRSERPPPCSITCPKVVFKRFLVLFLGWIGATLHYLTAEECTIAPGLRSLEHGVRLWLHGISHPRMTPSLLAKDRVRQGLHEE
jgi:hypothetical protein